MYWLPGRVRPPGKNQELNMSINKREQHILQALEQDERTQDYTFEIINEGGLITIRGEVDSPAARQAALEIVSQQEGAIKVVDEIQVAGGSTEVQPPVPSPEKIKLEPNQ
jgi:osmotically-inducible protein OsmY